MSLNFCDENPDQSTTNTHCWHDVKSTKLTRNRVNVRVQCCWCGDMCNDVRVLAKRHGKNASVMR